MSELGIYSVDELKQASIESIEQKYSDFIKEVMAACRYMADSFGKTEAVAFLEEKELAEPIMNYFKLKGFKVKQRKELEILISWE